MLRCKKSALGLWILASLLGCSFGYVTVKRSAKHHDCHRRPYDYQWQNSNVESRDYQLSDYNSYYEPKTSEFRDLHQSNPKPVKTVHSSCPSSFEEGQKLLQVYRLIRVIVLFRRPTKKHSTSLDKLVERLTKQSLQDQLVELVYHVDGYKEVATLGKGHHGHNSELFVDDKSRLLLAIQKALNALHLDDKDYKHKHPEHNLHKHKDHHHKGHGCCKMHHKLCKELRQLRDQANALTVSQIKKEMLYGAKLHAKGREIPDLNNSDQFLVQPYNAEEEQMSQNYQIGELNEFIIGLELLLQEQLMIAKAMFDQQLQDVAAIVMDEEISPPTNTLVNPAPPVASEDVHESWLRPFFTKGNLSPAHHMVDPVKKENIYFDELKRQEAEDIAEDATEGADEDARELPGDQLVKKEADEPSRLDLLADLVDQKKAESTTKPISIKPRFWF